MKRIAILVACAALLNACGGGSDQAEPQVSASNELTTARTSAAGVLVPNAGDIDSAGSLRPAESGVASSGRISASLQAAKGEVEVWVGLSQAPAAVRKSLEVAEGASCECVGGM